MKGRPSPAKEEFDLDWFLGLGSGGEVTRGYYRQLLSKMEGMVGRPLALATTRDLDTLKAALRKMRSGLQHVRTLRMFYSRCEQASRTPDEAFRFRQLRDAAVMKEKRPRIDPGDILTPDEVNTILNAALTLRDRALFGVLYETGCRVSEGLALDWKNVTREEPGDGHPELYVLWFPRVKVSGSEHQGFVVDTVRPFKEWLANHPYAGGGPLFCTASGARLTRGGAWRRLKTAAMRAGLSKPVHPHSFRHARATHLLASGWSEARVKKLLGWSPGSRQLDRYSHLSGNDVRRALLESRGFTVPKDVASVFAYSEQAIPPVTVKPVAGLAVPHPGPASVPVERVVELLTDPKVREFLELLERAKNAGS